MLLKDLLAAAEIAVVSDHPHLNVEVIGLTSNSQVVKPGYLFIGMPGTRVDGGEFWQGAIVQGAIAAVVSMNAIAKHPPVDQLVIAVEDMSITCGRLAAAFYHRPSDRLKMVGVTGTNGKTTTSHLIEFLLDRAGKPHMMIGTLYTRWKGFEQIATHTTPFPIDLQRQLDQAIQAGCDTSVMEVSSHALAQGRVLSCQYDVAVFTNLTQDHLDYHHNMTDYFEAKALLFSPQYLRGRAIVNLDDTYGKQLIHRLGNTPDKVWTYSTTQNADLHITDVIYTGTGVSGQLHTPLGTVAFQSPLVGQFNIANLLAAIGAGLSLGLDLTQMVSAIPEFVGVPGRMERVQIQSDQDVSVIVDYAHTPDSLENLLKAARPFISGQMICVFGCGGDRDRTKRPLMGEIVARLADVAVVTSDNPRTEDPNHILKDVLAGIPSSVTPIVNVDRALAIQEAILAAKPGDGILIAGKGHEDYQIIDTEKIHFDDREQARSALTIKYS